jgi:hypothetical protein
MFLISIFTYKKNIREHILKIQKKSLNIVSMFLDMTFNFVGNLEHDNECITNLQQNLI